MSRARRPALVAMVPVLALAPLAATGCGTEYTEAWFLENTVSRRSLIEVPYAGQSLDAKAIAEQLHRYDPGKILRCAIEQDPAYLAAIDELGGVRWGYSVRPLPDLSEPEFVAGYRSMRMYAPEASGDAGGGAVEIEEADIVGLSAADALFYSPAHGLFMVSLTGKAPVFNCAAKLPGRISKFFFHKDHLIVMAGHTSGKKQSFLLHFVVEGSALRFVEAVDLGQVSILDTRRFNDRIVVYTDMLIQSPQTDPQTDPQTAGRTDPSGEPASADMAPYPGFPYQQPRANHRILRVFAIGETLSETFAETLLDTSQPEEYMVDRTEPDTPVGTVVSESSTFGSTIWASDHYFVVTKGLSRTILDQWKTRTYYVCVKSHEEEHPYTHCETIYEERPNPSYVPPDNSGGDRACKSTTLSDCLKKVSAESSKTIQVPVDKKCEARIRREWICDERERRERVYPTFRTEYQTKLFIYEYTEGGFIRLSTQVLEITNEGLEDVSLDAQVEKLTTSDQAFDLMIDGMVQTLYFQGGFLYVIASGHLQVYAIAHNSLVRTSSMPLVNDQLQTALFAEDKIYLSDFGYSGRHDRSTLKVVDLSNPAFPKRVSNAYTLPGGHSVILPTSYGIMTIGTVRDFAPGIRSVLKLGLFSDPFAEELAYLILGTDLQSNNLGEDKSHHFDRGARQLMLPYRGVEEDEGRQVYRVGVSHLVPGEIVSEGAVLMPEMVARVRPMTAAQQQGMLAFGQSSIGWIVPPQQGKDWLRRPLLDHFTPVALYRTSDLDDFVEVLRLGDRCKLRFTSKQAVNQRDASAVLDGDTGGAGSDTSKAFDCFGYGIWAYANNIVFNAHSGVRFDADGAVEPLDQAQIERLQRLVEQRPVCLFSTEEMDDTSIDFEQPPSLAHLRCVSREQYDAHDQQVPSAPVAAD